MNIVERIVESPEGGTVHLGGLPLPDYGFWVGGVVSALIVDLTVPALAKVEVDYFIRYLRDENLCGYAGWWTDSETGDVWVDGVDWYASLEIAAKQARARHQIAFFDVANGTDVRVAPEA